MAAGGSRSRADYDYLIKLLLIGDSGMYHVLWCDLENEIAICSMWYVQRFIYLFIFKICLSFFLRLCRFDYTTECTLGPLLMSACCALLKFSKIEHGESSPFGGRRMYKPTFKTICSATV